MYAIISIYDDENRCIGKDKILTPCMVQHNATSTTYKFSAEAIVAEDKPPVMKGKFQHDHIPDELSSDKNKVQVCLKDLEIGQEFCWGELGVTPATVFWKDEITNRVYFMDKYGTFSKGGNTKVWIKKTDDIPEDESEEAKAEHAFLKKHKRMMENSTYGLGPRPLNHCIICKKVMYDDKAICDKCYEIAKKEGLLI